MNGRVDPICWQAHGQHHIYADCFAVDTICWHAHGQHHVYTDCSAVVPGLLAEGYANRYRNSWTAAVAATKTLVEEVSRRRGRPPAGAPRVSISMADLPVPVPLSRFQWPSVSLIFQCFSLT